MTFVCNLLALFVYRSVISPKIAENVRAKLGVSSAAVEWEIRSPAVGQVYATTDSIPLDIVFRAGIYGSICHERDIQ